MCVVYRGKSTHHLIAQSDGVFTINKQPIGNCTSLDDLVETLKSTRPKWPVALTDYVPNKSGGAAPAPAPAPEPELEEEEPEEAVPEPEEPAAEPEPKSKAPEKLAQTTTPVVEKAAVVAKKAAVVVEKKEEDKVEPDDPKTAEKKKAEARAKELLEDPKKLWVKGQKLDVSIVRETLAEDFGFALASKFRIAGRAKVISYVRPKSAATDILKIGDELL
jgi:hypothetical protein